MTLRNLESKRFQKTYRNDRVAFIHDCLTYPDGGKPSDYQIEIAGALDEHHHVAVKGPRRLGKSTLASWMTLHGVLAHPDVKVITIAPSWRQLTRYLWPEIHKWAGRINWGKVGRKPLGYRELLSTSINLSPTQQAFAMASDNPELTEGGHAEMMAMVYDEAKAIPDAFWDAVEGSMAAGMDNTMSLAISTPGLPLGRFYDIFARRPGLEHWHTISVTLEQAVRAGRVSNEWVDKRRLLWGENSALFKNYVLGEFGESGEVGIIPLADIEVAIERWHEWKALGAPGILTGIGVDVGGGMPKSDKTILAPIIDGVKVDDLVRIPVTDRRTFLVELVGRIVALIREYQAVTEVPLNPVVVVDMIGVGLGVYHQLNAMGIPAVGHHAGARVSLLDRTGSLGYFNVRAATWGLMGDSLTAEGDLGICLPPDDELIGDLLAPRIERITARAEIIVEEKRKIIRRIGRSPDSGDAVSMGLFGDVIMAQVEQDRMTGYHTNYEPNDDPGLW